jgi:hypothetical protein
MDRQLQEHYENQFSMFIQPAWLEFIEQCKELRTQYGDLLTVPDAPTLHKRQGQLDILDWVINRKGMYETAYKQLTDEADSA